MPNEQHTSKQYDAELEHISSQVLAMGALAQNQLLTAVESLVRGDAKLSERVIVAEQELNAREMAIDELCTAVIARRQPASNDLRLLMMVFKTITDLERIGDEAKKIALVSRTAINTIRHLPPKVAEIPLMAEIAGGMLLQALHMFKHLDIESAPDLARRDLELDGHFQAVFRQLLTYMIEDPRTISGSLDALFVAKSLERVGDHARNISEYVVYMIKGKDVRHVSSEVFEKTVKS